MPVQVGGNIGTPVIAMTETSRADQWNVLELSSFQLETIRTFRAAHRRLPERDAESSRPASHVRELCGGQGQSVSHAAARRLRGAERGRCGLPVVRGTDVADRPGSAASMVRDGRDLTRRSLMPLAEIPIPGHAQRRERDGRRRVRRASPAFRRTQSPPPCEHSKPWSTGWSLSPRSTACASTTIRKPPAWTPP